MPTWPGPSSGEAEMKLISVLCFHRAPAELGRCAGSQVGEASAVQVARSSPAVWPPHLSPGLFHLFVSLRHSKGEKIEGSGLQALESFCLCF